MADGKGEMKRCLSDGDIDSILSVSKTTKAIENGTSRAERPYMSLNAKECIRTGKLAEAIFVCKMNSANWN